MSTEPTFADDRYEPTRAERERMRRRVVDRLPQAVKDAVVTKGPGVYMLTAADLDQLRKVRDQIPVSRLFPALTNLRQTLSDLIRRMEQQDRKS